MARNSGKAVLVVLLVLLGAAGVAWYLLGVKPQEEVDAAWAAHQASLGPLTQSVEVAPVSEGPYHLAIRYGAETLGLLIHESVSRKMATQPPSADMGGVGEKIELSKLTVVSAKAAFPEDGSDILQATVTLSGTMTIKVGSGKLRALRGGQPSKNVVPIHPRAVVRVKMGADVHENRPVLKVTILSVDSFDLGAEGLPLQRLQAKVSEKIRQRISEQLTNPSNPESQRIMPLPEKLGKGGLPVELVAAGVKIVPGKDGEMFLGIVTNLGVTPDITTDRRGAPLGEHSWGLTLGQGTLGIMLRAMVEQGKIPSHFDRQGNEDAEGSIVFDIEGITLSDSGFMIASRIWNLKFPAFWRAFSLNGTMSVVDGRMTPNIDAMVGGESGGNTWLGDIVEKKLQDAPVSSVKSGGKSVPPRMPIPMSGGKRALQLNVLDVATGDGYMTVMGKSEVVDVEASPADAPAPEAAPAAP